MFLAGLTLATAGDLAAQRPHRSGLWIELGGGPSATRIACTECEEVTRGSGPIGYTRIGGVLSDGVLVGVESSTQIDEAFGLSDDDSAIARNEAFNAVLIWFPWRAGFFFKAGVGVASARVTVEPEPGSPVESSGTGVGMTFGIGWDFVITRHFAFTANAGSWINAIGDLILPDVSADDVIASRYAFTIGVTIR